MKIDEFLGPLGRAAAVLLLMSLAACAQGGATQSSGASPSNGSGASQAVRTSMLHGPTTSPSKVAATPVASKDPSAAIVHTIEANVAAANNEDIDAYMACLDPSSPLYASTRSQMTATFAKYDMDIEASDIHILDASAKVIHVQVVLTTIRVSGPAFRDNRITAVFEMHEVKGSWKVYGQTISDVEYL